MRRFRVGFGDKSILVEELDATDSGEVDGSFNVFGAGVEEALAVARCLELRRRESEENPGS